jgi:glycosyltransferase involved in cell wall biosynthesis/GT2 family glycosyltransferase
VRIAVAVAVHNRRAITIAWLDSLLASDLTGIDLRVVVVDDGSTDRTADALRERWPEIDLLTADGTLYYAKGTNRAIERTLEHDPDYVLVVNDDTLYAPDALVRLLRCAQRHPRSVVGPLLVSSTDPERVYQVFPRWHTRYGGWRHRHALRADEVPEETLDVELIVGNCVLVPAAAIREIGLMDETGVHNWVGDAEWTPRMRAAGWRLLIEPSALVTCHPHSPPESPLDGGATALLRALWEPLSPYGLRRMWSNRVRSAPDPARGVIAFAWHCARLALRPLRLLRWPDWPDEPVPGPGAHRTTEPPDGIDVVFVWLYLPWGGAQTHLLNHAAYLDDGSSLRALVPRGTAPVLLELLAGAGIQTEAYGPPIDLAPASTTTEKIGRRVRDARAQLAAARSLRRFDPATTVFHVDIAPWTSSLLLWWLARRRVVVQTLHTAPPFLGRARRWIWRTRLELVRSAGNYQLVMGNRDVHAGFEALLAHPIGAAPTPTSVDLDLVADVRRSTDAGTVRRGLGVPHDALLVVGVGQVVHRKGIDVLIDAVSQLDAHDRVVVRWIGDGPDRGQLERRARSLGLESTVRFVTAAEAGARDQLFATVAASDIYVQPSREEGLPLALVEAMALGRPVVASAVNGIPEVVRHEDTGLLVPAGDPSALAKALAGLIEDPARRAELGDAGRRHVEQENSAEAVATVLAQVYRHALRRRRARTAR